VTRAFLGSLLLFSSACTVLFDPSKAAPACPAEPPPSPARLVATVGAKGGRIDWTWPKVAEATAYRFCTSVPGGAEQCRDLDATQACVGEACATFDENLTDAVRVTGSVRGLDDCSQVSAGAGATTSATPIDTSSAAGWTLERGAGCATATSSVLGDTLALELTNASAVQVCLATLVTGDELWGDFTLEGVMRFSALTNRSIAGGFAVHVNAAGYRLAAAAAPDDLVAPRRSQFFRRKDGKDTTIATSIAAASATGTTFLRLVSKGGVLSFQLGPSREALREIMRVYEGPHAGRIGIGGGGQGRFEVSQLRVSTEAVLPEGGPTARHLDFADGGYPADTLPLATEALTVSACPGFAPACAGCAPPPGAACARCVRGPGLRFPTVAFDLPTGIDVRRPWRVSTRFAITPDAGVGSFPVVVSTPRSSLLGANTWALPTGGLGQTYGQVLAPGTWHTAEWTFDADGGRFGVTLDGQPVSLANPRFPLDEAPHLGSFTWCDGVVNDLVLHELSVSQP
jgi:hypothetical protein